MVYMYAIQIGLVSWSRNVHSFTTLVLVEGTVDSHNTNTSVISYCLKMIHPQTRIIDAGNIIKVHITRAGVDCNHDPIYRLWLR